MAQFINVNRTTTVEASFSDEIFIFPDVELYVTSGAAIEPTAATNFNIDVFVYGLVYGFFGGIQLTSSSDGTGGGTGNHDVVIGKDGKVIASTLGAITTFGANNTIINEGSVNGPGSDPTIRNEGSAYSLTNSGLIQGTTAVELITGLGGATTVETVINSGEITGTSSGVTITDGQLELINTGLISSGGSSFGSAIEATGSSINGHRIVNEGTMSSRDDAIDLLSDSSDTVINSGSIIGDIRLGMGDDTYDGRGGTVQGAVHGGDGNDIFKVDTATTEIIEEVGGGNDSVFALVSFTLGDNLEALLLEGSADLRGFGNAEDNLISGNSGDNLLSGMEGKDTMAGADGDDRMMGGRGKDTLLGNDGEDVLRGGRGRDELNGGDDDDILIGGRGVDFLTGGDGNDIFLFKNAFETTVRKRDKIVDFAGGEDEIDVSNLDPGKFTFIDDAKFDGSGNAELRVIERGTKSLVQLDLDGDGEQDLGFEVLDYLNLAQSDFVL
ncbi:MAG: M10 family metallopeptidase C-terminal domain-containing protein [Pseudomonadota bacterium]